MADATNLFNDDVTLLRAVVDFGSNVEWSQVVASVKRAEKTYLRTTFGSYYTDLLPKIGANNLDANDIALLDELRLASANLAWWLYTAKHNVSIDSTGIHQTHGDNQKPAFQWAVKDLRESFRDAGFDAIENTFEFLELNKVAYAYEASATYKAAKACLLSSAAEFQEYVDIMRSRYVFLQLIPEMKRIQRDVIRPIIGADAFNTIVKKLQLDNGGDNGLSAAETAQLELARPLLAYQTMADSAYKRSIHINELGALVHNSSYAGSVDGKQPGGLEQLMAYREEWLTDARGKINDLAELVNPTEEKTEEELLNVNTLDPDAKIGGFF